MYNRCLFFFGGNAAASIAEATKGIRAVDDIREMFEQVQFLVEEVWCSCMTYTILTWP